MYFNTDKVKHSPSVDQMCVVMCVCVVCVVSGRPLDSWDCHFQRLN